MISAIRAEFRKLLTVRSTYIILFICLVIEALFAFYITAYHASFLAARNPSALANDVTNALPFLIGFCGIIAILLVTHEYRYNTISYSLTANRSRTSVLLAKFIAVSVFALVFSGVFAMLAPALGWLGFTASSAHLIHQDFPFWDLLWRSLFYGWGYTMFALIIAFVVRSQVAALAIFLLVPGTIESLLGLLLKSHNLRLPFTTLAAVITPANGISYGQAALITTGYVMVGALIAWLLFTGRDAS